MYRDYGLTLRSSSPISFIRSATLFCACDEKKTEKVRLTPWAL